MRRHRVSPVAGFPAAAGVATVVAVVAVVAVAVAVAVAAASLPAPASAAFAPNSRAGPANRRSSAPSLTDESSSSSSWSSSGAEVLDYTRHHHVAATLPSRPRSTPTVPARRTHPTASGGWGGGGGIGGGAAYYATAIAATTFLESVGLAAPAPIFPPSAPEWALSAARSSDSDSDSDSDSTTTANAGQTRVHRYDVRLPNGETLPNVPLVALRRAGAGGPALGGDLAVGSAVEVLLDPSLGLGAGRAPIAGGGAANAGAARAGARGRGSRVLTGVVSKVKLAAAGGGDAAPSFARPSDQPEPPAAPAPATSSSSSYLDNVASHKPSAAASQPQPQSQKKGPQSYLDTMSAPAATTAPPSWADYKPQPPPATTPTPPTTPATPAPADASYSSSSTTTTTTTTAPKTTGSYLDSMSSTTPASSKAGTGVGAGQTSYLDAITPSSYSPARRAAAVRPKPTSSPPTGLSYLDSVSMLSSSTSKTARGPASYLDSISSSSSWTSSQKVPAALRRFETNTLKRKGGAITGGYLDSISHSSHVTTPLLPTLDRQGTDQDQHQDTQKKQQVHQSTININAKNGEMFGRLPNFPGAFEPYADNGRPYPIGPGDRPSASTDETFLVYTGKYHKPKKTIGITVAPLALPTYVHVIPSDNGKVLM